MSSYAYFVQTCREEHKKKHPEASVNFSEFSKKCSERWKVGENGWMTTILVFVKIIDYLDQLPSDANICAVTKIMQHPPKPRESKEKGILMSKGVAPDGTISELPLFSDNVCQGEGQI